MYGVSVRCIRMRMTGAPLAIGMMPSHPGAIVREEILAPLNLNVAKAAEALGVRRATLLNEKAALPAEMALRIEKAFGAGMETMLRIQTNWDIAVTRRREGEFAVPRYEPGQLTPRWKAQKRPIAECAERSARSRW